MATKNTMSQLGVDIEELKEMVGDSEVVTTQEIDAPEAAVEVEEAPAAKAAPRERSRKYKEARSQVDRTTEYPADQAVSLLKRLSYSKFDGTVTAHINLKRELKQIEVTFPHSTGKDLRVAIATDEVLEQLGNGEINFDILIADPKMMPKLAKFARLLGPRGLMPNPKTGTVSTDPEAKKKALESGALVIRPEKKANLMHIRIGKVSQPEEELQANLETLMRAVNPLNIDKVTIAATMSPGVKVAIAA
jgi:large subunit ribosomal protein L1